MKANEAPEHIYIFDNPLIDFTKLSQRQSETDIEYTRTDAFVEKAAEWLDKTLRNTDFYEDEIVLMVTEFKKAMKL